jgi:hypothetical protein
MFQNVPFSPVKTRNRGIPLFDRPNNRCYISVFCYENLSYYLSLLSLDRSLWPTCASERN